MPLAFTVTRLVPVTVHGSGIWHFGSFVPDVCSDEMTRSTDTRFIIITHNPITMARMNRLYGVTMAEPGVSQLVSVDLEGAVKLREAS
jgi:hypothetical protein